MDTPLISAPELAKLALEGDRRTSLLDVRWRLVGPWGQGEYAAGHIPGAAYVDLPTALAAPPDHRGRHPLPDLGVFERAMRAAGVRNDQPVVVYDDWGARAAARCWWLLKWAGHRDVLVLDGGLEAWRAFGGELRTGPQRLLPGDFVAGPGAMSLTPIDEVMAAPVLIDARAPERYRGEVEPVDPVAGHIPGAINRPTDDNLRSDGSFKSSATLAEIYRGCDAAVVYCGSGITACHDLLAMAAAGISGSLFAESWSGWITDPARAVER